MSTIKGQIDAGNKKQNFSKDSINILLKLINERRFNEAEEKLKKIEKKCEKNGVQYVKGLLAYHQNNPINAKKLLATITQADLNPYSLQAHLLMAAILNKEGKPKYALQHFKRALTIKPDNTDCLNEIGLIYLGLHKFDTAKQYLEKALAIKPDSISALNNLAVIYQHQRAWLKALNNYTKILAISPEDVVCLKNKANLCRIIQRNPEAIRCYRKIIGINPNDADALNELGVMFFDLGKYGHAYQYFTKAIELKPTNARYLNNLASVYKSLGQYDEAIKKYSLAIKYAPNHFVYKFNRGLIYLLLGKYRLGWFANEYRSYKKEHIPVNAFIQSLGDVSEWHSKEPLENKKILIIAEQGIGDFIQFMRYAEFLKKEGATIVVYVPKAIRPLLKECPFVDEFYNTKMDIDYYICVLSLPYAFHTNVNNIPQNTPYLFANPKKINAFKKIFNRTVLNVGLAWAGRELHSNDRNRSIAFEKLKPLFSLKNNVCFYSLQVGKRAQDIQTFGESDNVIDLSPHIQTYADTVALISHLDLVISVDTSVAHVTGAMEKPCWLLLPYVPDWRWLVEGNKSQWYPSMTLFRQKERMVWDNVIDDIKKSLIKKIKDKE